MRSKLWLSVAGILAGLFVVLWLTGAARGQQTLQASLGGVSRAVDPDDIVHIEGDLALSAGDSAAVYTVPAGRWLVLTDVEFFWQIGGTPSLAEKLGFTITTKRERFLNQAFHSRTGLAFRPGSQVQVREISFNALSVSYAMTGYLDVP